MTRISDKTVAILATDGFEQVELTSPKSAIEQAGGATVLISPKLGQIEANEHREQSGVFQVDVALEDAKASDYDALLIPGGLFNPDALRVNEDALKFVADFFDQSKPVFSICHGPQVLISADVVKGRRMTGFQAIQRDLKNAGAVVRDEAVVVDGRLVTSRNPDDLDAFNEKVLAQLSTDQYQAARHPVTA